VISTGLGALLAMAGRLAQTASDCLNDPGTMNPNFSKVMDKIIFVTPCHTILHRNLGTERMIRSLAHSNGWYFSADSAAGTLVCAQRLLFLAPPECTEFPSGDSAGKQEFVVFRDPETSHLDWGPCQHGTRRSNQIPCAPGIRYWVD